MNDSKNIKAIIGLGNPGPKFHFTRHNIGFLILDQLANTFNGNWLSKNKLEESEIIINGKKILLIKPQTFMNDSGQVIPYLQKKGINPEEILVVHDELEMKFGKIKTVFAGGARGHNGLRSIISFCGADFYRLRIGISRPENKEDVGNYVLSNFSEDKIELNKVIDEAIKEIERLI